MPQLLSEKRKRHIYVTVTKRGEELIAMVTEQHLHVKNLLALMYLWFVQLKGFAEYDSEHLLSKTDRKGNRDWV